MSQAEPHETDAGPSTGNKDHDVEQTLGNLLRAGVLLSAGVVLLGAILYLSRHGLEKEDYSRFPPKQKELTEPSEIVREAWALSSRGLIQLGLLLLIATPVARVAFSVYAFARQRDSLYVILTLIVLAVLIYSLFFGNG